MKTTLPWIKEHLQTTIGFNSLVDKLTEIGLEVENVTRSENELSDFKICKVIKSEKHPNADKLKLCEVDIGKKNLIKVVCAASNARPGLVTVYAPPGAIIPKTKLKLRVAKIRGVESHGMLCSEYELGLSNESEGIVELKNINIGSPYFKTNKEKVLDISITPNRPDCLGVRGIARDLSTAGAGNLKKLKIKKLKQKFNSPVKTKILKKKSGCLVFGTCYLKGVKNKESPDWLKSKIESLGLRPISAIVDITNYVMFDLNRPLHAYDANKIKGPMVIRNSRDGEKFNALDNKNYTLDKEMCAIADEEGVLGLGGVIGGTRSSTEFNTTNILLESALFNEISVRKTAKKLNINSDAKFRFERGVDPESVKIGLQIGAELIQKICGGEVSKFNLVGKNNYRKKRINLDINTFKNVIGTNISNNEIKKIMNNLGCDINFKKNIFNIIVPSWRPDLKEEIDLVEELIRIKGYEKIPLIHPKKESIKETLNSRQKLFHFTQRSVASSGFMETVTWSFTDSKVDQLFSELKKEIKLSNPISSDLDVLRSSLYSNLMISAKKNIDRDFEDFMLFEIGPVFKGKKPGEQLTMVGAIKTGKYSRKNWIEKERRFDVFDVKNDVLKTLNEIGIDTSRIIVSNKTKKWYHPGKSGLLSLGSANGPELAYFGEIHPLIIKKLDLRTDNILGFEIFLDNIPKSDKKIRDKKPQYIISDYQKVIRDFAFVIDEKYSSNEIINLVKNTDKELIKSVKIFDIYQGDNISSGSKSIAFSVTLMPQDKTLSDNDIEQLSEKIISSIKESTGATLRS